jgi:hypothetical protein
MTSRALCALALVVTLSAGCGGGSSPASDKAPSKAAATAAAPKINLVKGDVPADWTSTPHDDTNTADDKQITKDVATCLGISSTTLTGHDVLDVSSDDFAKGAPPQGLMVSSSVDVVTSTKDAKNDLSLFAQSKTPGCLQSVFQKLLQKQVASQKGISLGALTVRRANPSPKGVDGAFGFEISLSIQGPGITIPALIEIQGFLKRHTEVSLMTTSFGTPFPASQRDELYAKLVDRAKSSAV